MAQCSQKNKDQENHVHIGGFLPSRDPQNVELPAHVYTVFLIHPIRALGTQRPPISEGTRQREKKNVSILPTGVVNQIALSHN